MKRVFIAGATGYLGRHLVRDFRNNGWYVMALVRNAERARKTGLEADVLIEGQATQPGDINGAIEGADLVVSALGITRQKDGLTYRDVDYQANVNLLEAAEKADAARFAYVHVLGAEKLLDVALIRAKQDFVDRLRQSTVPSTVISPSGYFSDMADFLTMAKGGRVWLFGNGEKRLNPIHGADLARAVREAAETGRSSLGVGGPDVFTQNQLAELAFATLGKPARITHLPVWLARSIIWLLVHLTPQSFHGPVHFFMGAMLLDMVGEAHGNRKLAQHFATVVAEPETWSTHR